MTRFPTRVWATIVRHGLLTGGDRILVAVSGGADSVALLHVLAALAPRARARLVGLVHVHHGLRGAAADADAVFCEHLAAALGIPFDLVHVDVAAEAVRRRWSLERTGHALRHAAFRLVARRRLATRVAVGHTVDDQAETVLLRFLRGAGTRGLAGMWPMHGLLIRPLIEVRRTDVEHYAADRGLTWREDTTNRDLAIPRNRVRHDLLPMLMAVAGASLPERLARQAEAWRDDERWLAACVAVELPSVLMPHADGGFLLDLPRLDAVPPMLRRRVRMAVLEQMLPKGRVTLALVDGLERLETVRPGRRPRLGPLEVWRTGTQLRLELGTDRSPSGLLVGRDRSPSGLLVGRDRSLSGPSAKEAPPPALAEQRLTVPGVVVVEGADLRIEASVLRRTAWEAAGRPTLPDGFWVALDADIAGSALLIRGRQPGDRMRPTGAQGSQKIQDLMVNRKIARQDRDLIPILTNAAGRIAWVVGLAAGEEFAIQPHTTAVLLLHATRSGGKA